MQNNTSGNANQGLPQRHMTRPASIAPSISSVLSDATTLIAPAHEQRGFKSREAYLAALNDFAESRMYMAAGEHTLHGFYGGTTMEDYKNRPGLRSGKDKKKKSDNQRVASDVVNVEKRTTMPVILERSGVDSQDMNSERVVSDAVQESHSDRPEKWGKLRRLSRAFSSGGVRRASVS